MTNIPLAALIAATLAGSAVAQDMALPEETVSADASAAVAPAVPPGPVLDGKTLRAESLDGTIVNTIYLDAGGKLRIYEEPIGPEHAGSWYIRDDKLCLEFEPRGRECWDYRVKLERGVEYTMTSDRGMKANITLK